MLWISLELAKAPYPRPSRWAHKEGHRSTGMKASPCLGWWVLCSQWGLTQPSPQLCQLWVALRQHTGMSKYLHQEREREGMWGKQCRHQHTAAVAVVQTSASSAHTSLLTYSAPLRERCVINELVNKNIHFVIVYQSLVTTDSYIYPTPLERYHQKDLTPPCAACLWVNCQPQQRLHPT